MCALLPSLISWESTTSRLHHLFLPVLTRGGTSSEGAVSLGLCWVLGCGSVRAGVEDDDGDEDGG